MTNTEYAEDIAQGPDPDRDNGPDETDDDVAEAGRLMEDSRTKLDSVNRDVRAQGDWDLRGDD